MEHGAGERVEEQSHTVMTIKTEVDEAMYSTPYIDIEIDVNFIKEEPGLVELATSEPALSVKQEVVEDCWQDIAERQCVQGASTSAIVGSTNVFAGNADLGNMLNVKQEPGAADAGPAALQLMDTRDTTNQPEMSVVKREHTIKNTNLMLCGAVKKRIIEDEWKDAQHSKDETRPGQRAQPRPYRCDKCPKMYTRNSALHMHCTRVHGTESHECTECNLKYKCKEYLVRHVRNVHSEQQYECTVCKKMCKSKRALSEHAARCPKRRPADAQHSKKKTQLEQRVQPRPYGCDKCLKTFKCRNSLYTHRRRVHGTASHKCTECNVKYKCKEYLVRHVRNVHSKQQDECTICKKMCRSRHALYQHVSRHHRRRSAGSKKCVTICDYCQKRFTNKANVTNHISNVHSSRSYKCSQCDKCFKCKGYLTKHTARSHTTGLQVRVYTCDYCQKTFKRKSGIRTHIEKDHILLVHRCRKCNRNFNGRNELLWHKTNIHGKAKRECEVCKRVYKTGCKLREHVEKVHSSKDVRDLRTREPRVACPTADEMTAVAGTSTQRCKEVVVKQEPADGELQVGPDVFQYVDCNSRPCKEEPQHV